MKRSMRKLLPCASLSSLLLLSACGSEPEPEAAPAPVAKPVAKAGSSDGIATMAKAVGDGKPGAAVTIRYDFKGKPSAGTPTDLEIAFIPNAGVDSMEATLSGMDGITLAGTTSASFNQVESGKPYRHTVSVLPDRSGVFYVTVSITTQIAGSSLGRTFSVPFVVGQIPKTEKPAPQLDASGQAIEPMKAKETTG